MVQGVRITHPNGERSPFKKNKISLFSAAVLSYRRRNQDSQLRASELFTNMLHTRINWHYFGKISAAEKRKHF